MSLKRKSSVYRVFKDSTLRWFGFRKTINFTNPDFSARQLWDIPPTQVVSDSELGSLPLTSQTSSLTTEFQTHDDFAVPKGWYMLEIKGSSNTIGSNVSVRGLKKGSVNETWTDIGHILLGSHRESKCVVHLIYSVVEISILLDGEVDQSVAPELTFVKVTPGFAVDRMRKKLMYGTTMTDETRQLLVETKKRKEGESVDRLHHKYRKLMERHIRPVVYQHWLQFNIPGNQSYPSSQAVNTKLVARQRSEEELDYNSTITISVNSAAIEAANISHSAGPVTPGLTPSVTLFLFNHSGSSRVTSCLVTAVFRLLEDYSCDLKVILPQSSIDENLKKLSANRHYGISLLTYNESSDCSSVDDLLGNNISDVQILVDGESILTANSLLVYYRTLLSNSHAALIYSDHDSVDEFGRRSEPVFKPEWNPELLFNGNYIGSVFLLTRKLFVLSGQWQHRYEGSSAYDLLLRAAGSLRGDSVIRIPEVLWHNSESEDTPALFFKSGSRDVQVLSDYCTREQEANVGSSIAMYSVGSGLLKNTFKIRRELSDPVPSVEILIPSKDKVSLLRTCIESVVEKTAYPDFYITVIDNGSVEEETIEYFEELSQDTRIKILPSAGEFNFSALNNVAVNESSADVMVLLNNDTEVINPLWLLEMVVHAIRPEVGCVGAKLYYSNNRIQHGGVIVGLKGMAGHAHRFLLRDADGYCGRLKLTQNMSAVTAACLAVRREVYQQVGGLDEVNLKVAYNDVDFCLRVAEAGYLNLWTPYAELHHHESVSRGSEDTPEKAQRFQAEYGFMKERWNTDSWQDPAYNPNLARDLEDFSLSSVI